MIPSSVDLAMRVIFRCDYHLNQYNFYKVDYPPSCGWASSDQWKVLSKKTEVPQGRDYSSKLMLDSGMQLSALL